MRQPRVSITRFWAALLAAVFLYAMLSVHNRAQAGPTTITWTAQNITLKGNEPNDPPTGTITGTITTITEPNPSNPNSTIVVPTAINLTASTPGGSATFSMPCTNGIPILGQCNYSGDQGTSMFLYGAGSINASVLFSTYVNLAGVQQKSYSSLYLVFNPALGAPFSSVKGTTGANLVQVFPENVSPVIIVVPSAGPAGLGLFMNEVGGEFVNGLTCSDIKNNISTEMSVGATPPNSNTGQPTSMNGYFHPLGLPLQYAASLCGYLGFNYQQTITIMPAEVAAPFGSATGNPTPSAPFLDPVQGGYQYQSPTPCLAYPFYYDTNPNATACSINASNVMLDAADLLFNDNPQAACNIGVFNARSGSCFSLGDFYQFQTDLVGINTDGTPGPSLYRWAWIDNYSTSCTANLAGVCIGSLSTGGISKLDAGYPVDPGGNGGITLLSQGVASSPALVAAVLPASRSVQVGATATAFATIINAGPGNATACSIAPQTSIPANFTYQTTDPSTNAVTGTPNTPVDIAQGASQSFVIALTPSAAFTPTDVAFNFICDNATEAPVLTGTNTLLLSASTTPVPDIVALEASGDPGYVDIPGATGAGAFAVATVNVGADATITASANTGSATLPVTLAVCQTNSTTGACLATPAASVSTDIQPNATPTFGIFATGSGTIADSPGTNRIFVTFTDAGGNVRGETSVAVRTK